MKTPVVGFIGLGVMGGPMAMRLLSSGYLLHLFNRTKEKAHNHIARGAVWKESPAELAESADIVVTMVTHDAALLGVTEQIQRSLRRGGIHVDCSTVSPSLTTTLEKAYARHDKGFLHSPVLGSIPQATDGSLLLFVGGDESLFKQAEPVLNVLGSKIWRFPTAAQASNMKLIMNSFIGGMIATLSQALRHGEAASVDGGMILDVLSHSALNSTMYQTKGASILDNNFTPRFFLENLLKDTNLFRDAAAGYGVRTPVADTVGLLLKEAIVNGYAKDDYSAVFKIFEQPHR
jgi:3-hydroxyisobutyrate dehydrogenase-like beta-hydroxyacid dehydrogenase